MVDMSASCLVMKGRGGCSIGVYLVGIGEGRGLGSRRCGWTEVIMCTICPAVEARFVTQFKNLADRSQRSEEKSED